MTDLHGSDALLYGSDADVAQWLVTVGGLGRYAAVGRNQRWWRRWNGTAWEPCPQGEVHRAVRLALEAVYDRRMAANQTPAEVMVLLRLVDVNWRLGPLMRGLRRATALQDA